MKRISNHLVDEFLDACHEAARRGLIRCSSGNMSCRVDGSLMLASTTRSWMGRMTREHVAVCNIRDGKAVNGRRPTAEIQFHAAILRSRPDVNVVLHFQTPFATAVACSRRRGINYFVIPEIPFYIGPIAHVPYMQPGTAGLAQAVTRAMLTHDMAIMRNHGQATVAGDYDHAIQNAEFFELACEIIVRNGFSPRPIPRKMALELLDLKRKGAASGA